MTRQGANPLPRSSPAQGGLAAVALAAVWAAFDAIVHVRVDMVEPLRVAGNVVVWVALAVSLYAVRVAGRPKLAGIACGIAAGIVLVLNGAWVIDNGELPVPAAIFFGLAVVLLVLASSRFSNKASASEGAGD